jgi:fatty-acyl-CoA synthase
MGMSDASSLGNIYEQGLDKTQANFQPLTPLSYLDWAARVFPHKTAVIHGPHRTTWAEFDERCRRLASALQKRGIGVGDTVSVMSPNAPAMLEAHYGIPMSGAVLNALNYRLDAETIAFILKHAETKVLITDREYADVMKDAVTILDNPDLLSTIRWQKVGSFSAT